MVLTDRWSLVRGIFYSPARNCVKQDANEELVHQEVEGSASIQSDNVILVCFVDHLGGFDGYI